MSAPIDPHPQVSRAKAAESQLVSLRELVSAGQAQREASDRANEGLRGDLVDEKRRADAAEAFVAAAETKVGMHDVGTKLVLI